MWYRDYMAAQGACPRGEGHALPDLPVAGTFGAQFPAFCTYTYGSIHTVSITGVCN